MPKWNSALIKRQRLQWMAVLVMEVSVPACRDASCRCHYVFEQVQWRQLTFLSAAMRQETLVPIKQSVNCIERLAHCLTVTSGDGKRPKTLECRIAYTQHIATASETDISLPQLVSLRLRHAATPAKALYRFGKSSRVGPAKVPKRPRPAGRRPRLEHWVSAAASIIT